MSKITLNNKSILVTGAAGFIGSFLCKRLLEQGQGLQIIGLDCITDYYDVSLKEERLKMLEASSPQAAAKSSSIEGSQLSQRKPCSNECVSTV